jgi:hypothetical protein
MLVCDTFLQLDHKICLYRIREPSFLYERIQIIEVPITEALEFDLWVDIVPVCVRRVTTHYMYLLYMFLIISSLVISEMYAINKMKECLNWPNQINMYNNIMKSRSSGLWRRVFIW